MSKDSYYFKHDANARHDPKIHALLKTYGVEGYGRYWIILEVLRESSHYRIVDKPYMWESLAQQMMCSVEQVKKFVDDCVELFDLLTKDQGFIYSSSFLLRMQKLDEIREKRSRAGSWDR